MGGERCDGELVLRGSDSNTDSRTNALIGARRPKACTGARHDSSARGRAILYGSAFTGQSRPARNEPSRWNSVALLLPDAVAFTLGLLDGSSDTRTELGSRSSGGDSKPLWKSGPSLGRNEVSRSCASGSLLTPSSDRDHASPADQGHLRESGEWNDFTTTRVAGEPEAYPNAGRNGGVCRIMKLCRRR